MKFINNSNDNVYVVYSIGYPDTIPLNIPKYNNYGNEYSELKDEDKILVLCDWDSYFEDISSNILMIHIFRDTVNVGNVALNDIEFNINKVVKYPLFKRYDFTLQDLENLNWTVTYP